MQLFPHVPGHDGKLMKIPPMAGLRGRVHYTDKTGPGDPPDGTEVEVIGLGANEQLVRVFAVASGRTYELAHWSVDCGQVLFVAGAWRYMDDPQVVSWNKARLGNF